MSKTNFQDEEVDVEVESVPHKEKKKKSKEERSKDRRAVFLVLLIVLLTTFVFWLKANFYDKKFAPEKTDDGFVVEDGDKQRREEQDGFYVKYKI